jgi:hypothetical protein
MGSQYGRNFRFVTWYHLPRYHYYTITKLVYEQWIVSILISTVVINIDYTITKWYTISTIDQYRSRFPWSSKTAPSQAWRGNESPRVSKPGRTTPGAGLGLGPWVQGDCGGGERVGEGLGKGWGKGRGRVWKSGFEVWSDMLSCFVAGFMWLRHIKPLNQLFGVSCEPSRNGSMGLVSGLNYPIVGGMVNWRVPMSRYGVLWVHNQSAVIRLPILNDIDFDCLRSFSWRVKSCDNPGEKKEPAHFSSCAI